MAVVQAVVWVAAQAVVPAAAVCWAPAPSGSALSTAAERRPGAGSSPTQSSVCALSMRARSRPMKVSLVPLVPLVSCFPFVTVVSTRCSPSLAAAGPSRQALTRHAVSPIVADPARGMPGGNLVSDAAGMCHQPSSASRYVRAHALAGCALRATPAGGRHLMADALSAWISPRLAVPAAAPLPRSLLSGRPGRARRHPIPPPRSRPRCRVADRYAPQLSPARPLRPG